MFTIDSKPLSTALRLQCIVQIGEALIYIAYITIRIHFLTASCFRSVNKNFSLNYTQEKFLPFDSNNSKMQYQPKAAYT